MADSKIEWTDATWNPVAGCSIMSAGCKNCYAMNMARRLELMGMDKYSGLTRKSGKRVIWNNRVKLDYDSINAPLRWRSPKLVFVNSMSDLFHEKVPEHFIEQIWKTMEATPQHTYQILTKRPDRMNELVRKLKLKVLVNVWLGTSVEDHQVTHRIAELRKVPAAVRFVSFEPLIGSVGRIDLKGIHWAIVGGESGSSARKVDSTWIDEVFDACREQETAFFFKQWGAWGADGVRRSKKLNGRLYRNRYWDEMPKLETSRRKVERAEKPIRLEQRRKASRSLKEEASGTS